MYNKPHISAKWAIHII